MVDHPDHIHTGHDTIPHFCANENMWPAHDGVWSDPGSWNLGRVPGATDIVTIRDWRIDVDTIDAVTAGICMEEGGELNFLPDRNTALRTINMMVLETGTLRAEVPDPAFTAAITLRDVPLDTVFDPRQWGNAIIAIDSTVRLAGAEKTAFLRTTFEPKIGHAKFTLESAPQGWRNGDLLYIPDTRSRGYGDGALFQGELRTVINVIGNEVFFTPPLLFNHSGARDDTNTLRYTPHVMNLTRNVVVHSENPVGTRGHIALMGKADVVGRYVELRELGRTKAKGALNSYYKHPTTGVVTIGTNQIGRYAWHAHHLIGPAGLPANVPQFDFTGLAIFSSPKWGIVLHDSHHGRVQHNVTYKCLGAGLMAETGNESFNLIDHNFMAASHGSDLAIYQFLGQDHGVDNIGHEGSNFWFHGASNSTITNNVAANATADGFTFGNLASSFSGIGELHIPKFKGADPNVEGEYDIINSQSNAVRKFKDNEAYGSMERGLRVFEVGRLDGSELVAGGAEESIFENMVTWNVTEGAEMRGNQLTYKNLICLGDKSKFCHGGVLNTAGRVVRNIKFMNPNIQGCEWGISIPAMTSFYLGQGGELPCDPFTIDGGYMNNTLGNISIPQIMHDGTGTGSNPAKLPPRKVLIRNVRYGGAMKTITTQFPTSFTSNLHVNYIQNDEIIVEGYDGDPEENFRLFFKEQSPDFLTPVTTTKHLGAPVAGLTNAQNLAQHGVCVGGIIAPNTDATTHPEIVGYVADIELEPEDPAVIAELQAQIAALNAQIAALQAEADAAETENEAQAAAIAALGDATSAAQAETAIALGKIAAAQPSLAAAQAALA